MERRLYYVKMSGEISQEFNDNDTQYDFEVIATPEEIEELRSILDKRDDQDFKTFLEAHIPYRTEKSMMENLKVDDQVHQIYEMIYRLGSVETKRKIEEAGLLDHV